MDRLTFLPSIDIPIVGITLALMVWHFNQWAHGRDAETNVDLVRRLPMARVRVVVLFVGFLVLCWLTNFAAWFVFAVLIGVGLSLAILMDGSMEVGGFGLWAAAWAIREWSFGFPTLILHPARDKAATLPGSAALPRAAVHQLVGKSGTTTSPLRPAGDAIIDGETLCVASDDGSFIEAGTQVVVTSVKTGRPRVRIMATGD
jgi:membrane-bound ClpP family serine protease